MFKKKNNNFHSISLEKMAKNEKKKPDVLRTTDFLHSLNKIMEMDQLS